MRLSWCVTAPNLFAKVWGSPVRDMMPSSCVFCLAEWFWLFGFDMKQPESLILAQDERWRQA